MLVSEVAGTCPVRPALGRGDRSQGRAVACRDLDRAGADLPKIFSYKTHAENKSLYNTAPTFAIYLVRNVLDWVKGEGGLDAMEKRNREKAKLVYGAIDAHADFYRCPVEPASR